MSTILADPARCRPHARLIADLADVLTGPTSGHNAARLAEAAALDPDELAFRLYEIADRYLGDL